MSMPRRYGSGTRWADMVVHRGVAYWVEVAEDRTCDARGQIAQVLAQIDATLQAVGSNRTRLIQVLVYLADLAAGPRHGAGGARHGLPGRDGRDGRR